MHFDVGLIGSGFGVCFGHKLGQKWVIYDLRSSKQSQQGLSIGETNHKRSISRSSFTVAAKLLSCPCVSRHFIQKSMSEPPPQPAKQCQ